MQDHLQKHELFGFEQGPAQSAAAIVEAAKQFGQEDDITVISITRAAVLDLEPAKAARTASSCFVRST
jgi:hypothetical protein